MCDCSQSNDMNVCEICYPSWELLFVLNVIMNDEAIAPSVSTHPGWYISLYRISPFRIMMNILRFRMC